MSSRSIEERLQRVEDELAIQRIIFDYSVYLDSRNWEGFVSLFAPDGVWTNVEGTYQGREAIMAMLGGPNGGPAEAPKRVNYYHANTNWRIELDGDRASAVSRYLFVLRRDDRPTSALAGQYTDEYVRIDGAWKIARREAEELIPTHAEWEEIFLSKVRT
ncbi:nuclear transport factor 2 family protein [Sphingobium nicotianae]|uniref:Nuclear transport factor 2 family protein n=1 Tax=Sphingobium nicotianae TaxID=2782607 RepID=A0A9X1DCD9_9SPHN|nr:nuclear transport factor 2 family protein [Sphingobium nicotianae]MBT2187373.1 nuclear transport factor 2 family protein [Sphingobium nicotianae]